jgi:hypothetical protein
LPPWRISPQAVVVFGGIDYMAGICFLPQKGLYGFKVGMSTFFGPTPLPDYNLKSWEVKGLARFSLVYILSGGLGAAVVVLVTFLLGKMLRKKNNH